MLTGRTLPSDPTRHPHVPWIQAARPGGRVKPSLPLGEPLEGSGRLGAPSSSRGLSALTPVVLYGLVTGHCGRQGWTGGVEPDCDNPGSAQREQSRCLGSRQSREQPPPSATKRPRERWIIGFDLRPESSPGRDSSSGSPDGRGVCHSGRDQQGERPAGGGGRGL